MMSYLIILKRDGCQAAESNCYRKPCGSPIFTIHQESTWLNLHGHKPQPLCSLIIPLRLLEAVPRGTNHRSRCFKRIKADWRRGWTLQYAVKDLATDATINPPFFAMEAVPTYWLPSPCQALPPIRICRNCYPASAHHYWWYCKDTTYMFSQSERIDFFVIFCTNWQGILGEDMFRCWHHPPDIPYINHPWWFLCGSWNHRAPPCPTHWEFHPSIKSYW